MSPDAKVIDSDDTVRAPGWFRIAMELRAPLEFAASVAAFPWLATAPRGDGHSVIVYPGFLGSDLSTRPMRRLLRWLGHEVQGWGQGRNLVASAEVMDSALQRIHDLHRQRGRRISLVGWSLGGLYARELAKMAPEAVRAVVTLGSPFTGPREASNARRTYEWLQRGITPEKIDKVKRLQPIADELGGTLAQLGLAWCLTNPNVSTVITGASRAEQVTENMKALDIAPKLTPEILERIEGVLGNRPE